VKSITTTPKDGFIFLDADRQKTIQEFMENKNVTQEEIDTLSQALRLSPAEVAATMSSVIVDQSEARWRRKVELSLLESLRFDTMTYRYEAISEAHQKTFEWIFQESDATARGWSNFSNWLEAGSGIYWIKGKAGSGKSTLMKFISEHPRTHQYIRRWAQDSNFQLSSYFFWNSGTPEQRSRTGLLRSILYDVLQKHTDIIPAVFPNDWKKQLKLGRHGAVSFGTWSMSNLQSAFENLVQQSSNSLRFCFFIDGLDEYEGDHMELAQYFLKLAKSPCVKFCISSRPWLVFEDCFRDCPSLRLQDLTYNDIQIFVKWKFMEDKKMKLLAESQPKEAVYLTQSILEKGDGVFLWVAIVVKSLLRGLKNRDQIRDLRVRLDATPADLEDLYTYMLDSIETVYKVDSSMIFQSYRAIMDMNEQPHAEKVYGALSVDLPRALGTPKADIERAAAEPIRLWERGTRKEFSHSIYDSQSIYDYMKIRLATRCGGLLEIRLSEDGDPFLSYIHRTAKDYVESKAVWNRLLAYTSLIPNGFDPNMALLMHSVLSCKRAMGRKWGLGFILSCWDEVSRYARIMPQSSLDIQILLLDEFDSVALQLFEGNQHGLNDEQRMDLQKVHWTNFHLPSSWKTSFLSEAIRRHLVPYAVAKLNSNPSPDSPLYRKLGMPLLGFTFLASLDSHIPREMAKAMEALLRLGANPNELYEGHSLWQYWLHAVHTEFQVKRLWGYDITMLSYLKNIFVIFLECGADVDVCCLEDAHAWRVIYPEYSADSFQYKRNELIAHGNVESAEKTEDSQASGNSITNGASFKELHSLTTVIKNIFNTQNDPTGAAELLEIIAKHKTENTTKGDELLLEQDEWNLKRHAVQLGNSSLRSEIDFDTDSEISSNVASVLSVAASKNSSKTSNQDKINQDAADEFVLLLLKDEHLKSLYMAAIQNNKVGADRFERNFRRLLNQYSVDLMKEANSGDEKSAAYLVRSRSRYIANDVRRKLVPLSGGLLAETLKGQGVFDRGRILEEYLNSVPEKAVVKAKDEVSDSDSESELDDAVLDDGVGNEKLIRLSKVKDFMTSSKAFLMLRSNFQQFVQPDFRSKLSRLIEKRSGVIGHTSLALDLAQIEPYQLTIIFEDNLSFSNRLKGIFEDLTQESWEWWPFKPRKRSLHRGEARLLWSCVSDTNPMFINEKLLTNFAQPCGEERWAEVPLPFAKALARLLKQFPGQPEAPQVPTDNDTSTITCPAAQRSTSGGNQTGAAQTTSISSSSQKSSQAESSGIASDLTGRSGHGTATDMDNQPTGNKYVLLGVASGDELKLAQIDVKTYKDDQFFTELKEEYRQLRGPLRCWLSIWCYSHCDFSEVTLALKFNLAIAELINYNAQFEKIDDNEIVLRGPGIPDPENKNYQYQPKPMKKLPPVSEHEFRRRFYTCHKRCLTAKVPFSRFLFFHRCRKPCRPLHDALDRIPKKVWRVEEEGDAREFFWGIHGVERISFCMVAFYHLVILLPPLVFWFLWLFWWGHSGDLQNASVPFLSALGLISLFWFPLKQN
jgi:hypothetical protein